MSSPMFVRVHGLYATLQVAICVDSRSEKSLISDDFVLAHRVAQSVRSVRGSLVERTVRGPVIVPTIDGYYQSTFELIVGSVRGCDVLLGRDWILGSVCHVHDDHILDPFVGSVFLPGHVWARDIPGECSLLVFV